MTLPCCLTSRAQPEKKDSLAAAFTRFQLQSLQEKLFVHVDRTLYLAGETIWFKVYDIDASTDKPLVLSSIAYVEILDHDQRQVLQSKTELKDGNGNGSFRIPASIPSGQYTFRAYTSWMKNFSPDFFYHQQLTILNTLNEASAIDSLPPIGYAIRFFPEGGNLVNGLSSVIAFKSVDHTGKCISSHGVIVDQKKDTVASFQTTRFGIGRFTFSPLQGNTYYALATIGDSLLTQSLPASYDQGYVMHLNDDDGNKIRITVRSTISSANPTLYMLLQTRNRIKNVQAAILANNETGFLLNKDSLSDGISQITIFNGDRSPICERLYFNPPRQQLQIGIDPSTADASVSLAAGIPTRTKLSINLTTTDRSGQAAPADLSMSVFLVDSLQTIPAGNILSYLLLSSDLKGKIDSPQSYFENPGPATTEALDNLMLTQGWTRFRWEDILQNKRPYFEFLPETNGPVINGKVTDRSTGAPPSSVIGYLSVPGKHFELATTLSKPDGSLAFHLNNFYGTKLMVIQTDSRTDSNCRIEVANPFSDRFSTFSLPDFHFSPAWRDQLLNRSINAQAENAYRIALKRRFLLPAQEDTLAFYGTADRKYNLDEYTRFVTMDEVIREYVEDVRVRRQSGRATFRVRDNLFNVFFEGDPLLLLDGVPIFDGDKIMGTDPLKIRKIEVVSHRYEFGPSITDGIVSFMSYEGDLAGHQLDPNAVAIQYNGLDQQREFYSPVYENSDQVAGSIPDLRSQLLWSPGIRTNASGKITLPLYTSDYTGKFVLVVQGLTKDGLPGFAISTFSVNPRAAAQ